MLKTGDFILAIDDDASILRFLQNNLRLAGYMVQTADSGMQGLQLAQAIAPDLILLDLGLPDVDGLQLLGQLRQMVGSPIIIITARDDEDSMCNGLNLGADDYLIKPCSGRTLRARIEAVLRRYRTAVAAAELAAYQHGPVSVDVKTHAATLNGRPINLTRIEFALLVELIRLPGRVRLHSDLLTQVWGPEYRDDVTVLRAAIYRLRQKIESDPARPVLIRTESGIGYSVPSVLPLQPEPFHSPLSFAPSQMASQNVT
jgi:two-component system KDP operon response regulator KdpE